MSNIKVFFKNFTAGRKALFKRMGIYLASSLAVFEAANIFLEDGAVGQWCEAVSLGGIHRVAFFALSEKGVLRMNRRFQFPIHQIIRREDPPVVHAEDRLAWASVMRRKEPRLAVIDMHMRIAHAHIGKNTDKVSVRELHIVDLLRFLF